MFLKQHEEKFEANSSLSRAGAPDVSFPDCLLAKQPNWTVPGTSSTFTRHCNTNYHVYDGAIDLTYTLETNMRDCLAACAKYNSEAARSGSGCIGVSFVHFGVQAGQCWLKGGWGRRTSNGECETGILLGKEPGNR